jgi:hypothetical protein
MRLFSAGMLAPLLASVSIAQTEQLPQHDRLGINLLLIRSSPFFGEQTFRIAELSVVEPGEQLFALPDDPFHDREKPPPISQ